MTTILAPARNCREVRLLNGAGARGIYAGLSGYCRNEKYSVTEAQIKKMARVANESGGFLVTAINRLPPPGKEEEFIRACIESKNKGAAGVILNDPGLIRTLRNRQPETLIMASVGMAPVNSQEARFILNCGADTVLASEFLSLGELVRMKKETGARLEIFIRGEREYSYTGKCILSSYCRGKRSPAGFMNSARRGGGCGPWCRGDFILESTGDTLRLPREKFNLSERVEPYLGLVDYFKVGRGSLNWDDFMNIITLLAEKIQRASAGADHGIS